MPVLFSCYKNALRARLRTMKTADIRFSRYALALALALCSAESLAANTTHILYKCTDQSGVTLYTNQKTKDKNCIVLSVQVPPPPSNRVSANGVLLAPSDKNTGGTAGTKTPTPADFPRVSGDDQKARDNDRRAILDRELALERANLEKLRVPTAAVTATAETKKIWQDSITLHERNIEALNKEIARLR